MSFARDLALLCERAKENKDQVIRQLALSLCKSLVEKSPVGNPELWVSLHPSSDISGKGKVKFGYTREAKGPVGYVGGRFRANWHVGDRLINFDTTAAPDADGGAAINRAKSALEAIKLGGVIYLTNSLPYAKPLEYGHSSQTPAGMVRITVAEFQQHVAKAAGSVK